MFLRVSAEKTWRVGNSARWRVLQNFSFQPCMNGSLYLTLTRQICKPLRCIAVFLEKVVVIVFVFDVVSTTFN